MLVVVAERALGRRPAFSPDPPNALPVRAVAASPGRRRVLQFCGQAPACTLVASAAHGSQPPSRCRPLLQYHRLAYEGGRLTFRAAEAGEGGDALGLAAAASAEERPPSGVVTDREAAAALGEGFQPEEPEAGGGSGGSGSRGTAD